MDYALTKKDHIETYRLLVGRSYGHGNLIICPASWIGGDTRERSGYHTIKSGTYKECLAAKEDHIETYRLIVLKQALHLYAKFKMQANRSLTPSHMLKLASAATGAAYKRGEHAHAAEDVAALIALRRL